MKKKIYKILHIQRDVGNAINSIIAQHVMIGIMDAKNLTLLKRNIGHYILSM